jgi:hypothetical protein
VSVHGSDTDEQRERVYSRRGLLGGGAKFAGAGVLAVALAGTPLVASARGRRPSPGGGGRKGDDLDVLNYALTLEHLEANFYIQGVDAFSETSWNSLIASMGFGMAVSGSAWEYLTDVRDHEVTHVNALISVIESLNGDPVPPCEYDFSAALASEEAFLATAMVLENTGVMAYDGAIARIGDGGLITAAATIATVEARHASYFNLLNGANPFPAAFDTATAPADIIAAVLATGLVVSCPVAPPIPD